MKASSPTIRPAEESDLAEIVRMLADDTMGSKREKFVDPLPASYYEAFEAIQRDPNNELVVAENETANVVAVLQLTITPFITHQGGWRATIEGVRVDRRSRTGASRKDPSRPRRVVQRFPRP